MYLIQLFKGVIEILSKYWYYLIVEGLSMTLLLSVITVAFGTVLGSALALVKMGKIKPLKWIVNAFVEVVRGTPMLLQLFIGKFLIPSIFPAMKEMENATFLCVCITLVINSAAYVSEIIRSGIEAVDKGQPEAARSLGLNSMVTMTEVVLPQAIKNILPALGNEFITVIKETSLASNFFVGELMTIYNILKGITFKPLEIYMAIGVIYFVVNFALSKALKFAERKMKARA